MNVFLPTPGEVKADEAQNEALINLIIEIIDAVKDQVNVKHWRSELP